MASNKIFVFFALCTLGLVRAKSIPNTDIVMIEFFPRDNYRFVPGDRTLQLELTNDDCFKSDELKSMDVRSIKLDRGCAQVCTDSNCGSCKLYVKSKHLVGFDSSPLRPKSIYRVPCGDCQ